jgi:hypothetical protein
MKNFIKNNYMAIIATLTLIVAILAILAAYHINTLNEDNLTKAKLQDNISELENKLEAQDDKLKAQSDMLIDKIDQMARDMITQGEVYTAKQFSENASAYFPNNPKIVQLNDDIATILSKEYQGPTSGSLESIPNTLPEDLKAKGYFYVVDYWFPSQSNSTVRYFGYEKPNINYEIADGHWWFELSRKVARETSKQFEARNKKNNARSMYKYGNGFDPLDGLTTADRWFY